MEAALVHQMNKRGMLCFLFVFFFLKGLGAAFGSIAGFEIWDCVWLGVVVGDRGWRKRKGSSFDRKTKDKGHRRQHVKFSALISAFAYRSDASAPIISVMFLRWCISLNVFDKW